MLSSREIKSRIRGVTNIQQITRAMEMVAAARLRRAQDAARAGRPYADKLYSLVQLLAGAGERVQHPLLAVREPTKRAGVFIVTADKGLCGAYSTNIIRKAERFVKSLSDIEVELTVVGRKGINYFQRREYNIVDYYNQFTKEVLAADVSRMAAPLMEAFLQERVDEVHIVYTRYESAFDTVPTVQRLLPLDPGDMAGGQGEDNEFIYEPSAEALFNSLMPVYFENQLFRALGESLASELGARMVAMRNATDNADEMIRDLTLSYNKVRQASITKAILEIVSGAEALA